MEHNPNNPRTVRFSNYCVEKTAIEKKLNNPRVPEGKKERLRYRLRVLNEILIPGEASVFQ